MVWSLCQETCANDATTSASNSEDLGESLKETQNKKIILFLGIFLGGVPAFLIGCCALKAFISSRMEKKNQVQRLTTPELSKGISKTRHHTTNNDDLPSYKKQRINDRERLQSRESNYDRY